MKNTQLKFYIAAYMFLVAAAAESTILKDSMDQDTVVPDVIDEAPGEVLEVTFSSGVKADLGNELTPTSVKDIPAIKWNAESDAFYTVALVDADAPNPEASPDREFKHWLVVNVPGNDVSKGDPLAAYIGAGPPKNMGLHRYVFLVYKQNGKLTFDETSVPNTSREDRPSFSIRKFAKKYNLGQPVAGNFYLAQWDEYVPILLKQLA